MDIMMKYTVDEYYFAPVDRKKVDVFVGNGFENHTRFEHGPKYVAYKGGRFMTGVEYLTVKNHIKTLFHTSQGV